MSRLSVQALAKAKREGQPLVALTAYDAAFARLIDQTGVDIILVGDSVGNTLLGFDSTLPVTLTMMCHHAAAVARGSQRALLGVDVPFGVCQQSHDRALADLRLLAQDSGCQFVKIEGAEEVALIEACVAMGVPVMGHLGYLPQQLAKIGKPTAFGRTPAEVERLTQDARALERAGVCALVLEMVPSTVAKALTAMLSIPTIGIGSGPHCDGQILVLHDVLGLDPRFQPRFSKRYAHLDVEISKAVTAYVEDVRQHRFPDATHSPY